MYQIICINYSIEGYWKLLNNIIIDVSYYTNVI